MGSDRAIAAVGGAVVALAVAGIGYLALGAGRKPPAAPEARLTEPAAPRRAPTTPPPTRLAPPPKAAPAPRAPTPPVSAPPRQSASDNATYVADLLRQYDDIMGSVDTELTLGERRRRIDEIVALLAQLGPEGVPALVGAFEKDALANLTARQMLVVRALALIPGAEATSALEDALKSSQWGVQMAVVTQLATRGEEGYKVLEDRILVEPDYRVRGAILKQIGQRGGDAATELIARLARTDPDENVRRAAVRQLSLAKDDPEAARVLEDLARSAPEVSVRQAAIQGYAQAAGESSVPVLDQMAQSDPNLHVRAVAILGLQVVGAQGSDEAVRVLDRIANDPRQSADVQARARGAMAAVERQRQGGGAVNRPIRSGLRPVAGEGLKPLAPHGDDP